jgi:DNA-binding transcriptional LysR family regulator
MRGLLPQLRVALTLGQTEAIKRAVEAGMGLGCVSRIALEDAFERSALKPCRVPHRDFSRQFHFLLHKHKQRGPGVERWLAFCRDE